MANEIHPEKINENSKLGEKLRKFRDYLKAVRPHSHKEILWDFLAAIVINIAEGVSFEDMLKEIEFFSEHKD
ncbi:hypothetical protein Ab1vBOLIVR2_gp18 [Agrobacterium phage OLIVR2]|uniref:Uncharacterized protein n=1 Tax=Agrobacterium phage OLIVR1 TaxID=2723769 RepID=A0A858MRN0_9CAUD|nr:hypothetical protein [Xanthomonas campestris]YP_010107052.1 hypothetical protein KNU98_gp091 [Agrobacterium phage OLIVR1]QIW87321.1 hypothetical protein Ab1vBOLIVR2_gp18 [Agrobacterium phage OLIVR2]QIW87428.1 hypothetical protein Ab1vBOLIVR3_gp18 [Agrobacterium phage OLIVR3]MCF8861616.1 hypothetical protein [Xanthomonas campestris pv. campestris]QIW87213.1 hypothetical protein Ab1vBOLIVR1_gp18 [Agrobacterium phage OLIVR1]